MSEQRQKPRRAYVLTLELQANTKKELRDGLYHFFTALDRGELSGKGVSGSPSSGWIYNIDIDESITKEAYFAAIDEYLAQEPHP